MPVSDVANVLALRAHALSMPVVTIAQTDELGSTSTGYFRVDGGSFIEDGFVVGMEVEPSSFTETSPGLIVAVTDSTLTIEGGRQVQAADFGRQLSVGLPPARAWEGSTFSPEARRWYVDEDYLPGSVSVMSVGPQRQLEAQPAYLLTLYSPPGFGILAPYAVAESVLRHFAALTPITLPSGDVLRVRGDAAPYRSKLAVIGAYEVITVTIPLRLRTANSI